MTRSNFGQLADYCTEIAPRFPGLLRISFEAATPFGLASRDGYAEYELVTEEQWTRLAGNALCAEIGPGGQAMSVEADGSVRAMTFYEGTVDNLRSEPWDVLWERSIARWSDPFLTETLRPVRTMREWAAARILDLHFASAPNLARIDHRPSYPLLVR